MKLYDHQRKIITEDPKKAGLFLGTGSGKTRIALLLARGRVLIIAPKTQVEDENWQRELQSIAYPFAVCAGLQSEDFIVSEGHRNFRQIAYEQVNKPTLTVISKEAFRRDHAQLERFDTVIVDEAHTCLGVTAALRWENRVSRPKTSQLFEALQTYIERTKPERFYLCTATIMRSAMTVWGAGVLLGKKWDWYKFRSAYYTPVSISNREVWLQRTDSATKDRLAKCVRELGYTGRLEEFFDVPDQTFRDIRIEMTPAQRTEIKSAMYDFPEPLVRTGKVHQIENGIVAGDEFSSGKDIENGKIDAILELAAEFPRMIVFAKYTRQIQQISRALLDAKYTVSIMAGDTKDRGTLLEVVRSKPCVFIVQAQISAGWEYPECPVTVFASRTNSFVDYDQALGRVQRANAIKKNLYINLITKSEYVGTGRSRVKIGGVDEAVDSALKNKQDFNERIYSQSL